MSETKFEIWGILELMGHRRLAGRISEEEISGASFVRIDVPGTTDHDPRKATQFYSPQAVYCITPTTEGTAREIARESQPTPVAYWELPRNPQLPEGGVLQWQTDVSNELLEALEGVLGVIETDNLIPESVSYIQAARQAIAKARGEDIPF